MIKFSKHQILLMTLPGDLFSSPNDVEDEFRKLSVRWHPDHEHGDKDVMAKINELRGLAKEQIDNGKWEASNSIVIPLKTGKKAKIQFRMRYDIGIGEMLICDTCVVFVLKNGFDTMAKNINIVDKCKFAGKRMEDEIKKYLPRVNIIRNGANGETIVIVNLDADLFPLYGVLQYFGGKVPPKHVAWILNTLYNLCCYFSYTGVTHNSILLDTYFINPKEHSGSLLGGWWYAVPRHEPIAMVPYQIYSILPVKVKNSRIASVETDLESIKLIGRQLLGDSSGVLLDSDKDIPEPIIQFLRDVSTNDAVREYKRWGEVLKESFGPRRFVKMEIDIAKFYTMRYTFG